ncbi:hypothetical protein HK096_007415, partial [Nowakowskiella sp. JEL0078]
MDRLAVDAVSDLLRSLHVWLSSRKLSLSLSHPNDKDLLLAMAAACLFLDLYSLNPIASSLNSLATLLDSLVTRSDDGLSRHSLYSKNALATSVLNYRTFGSNKKIVLPTELWTQIFRHLKRPSDLYTCLTISKTLHHTVMPLLWHTPSLIPTPSSHFRFLNSLYFLNLTRPTPNPTDYLTTIQFRPVVSLAPSLHTQFIALVLAHARHLTCVSFEQCELTPVVLGNLATLLSLRVLRWWDCVAPQWSATNSSGCGGFGGSNILSKALGNVRVVQYISSGWGGRDVVALECALFRSLRCVEVVEVCTQSCDAVDREIASLVMRSQNELRAVAVHCTRGLWFSETWKTLTVNVFASLRCLFIAKPKDTLLSDGCVLGLRKLECVVMSGEIVDQDISEFEKFTSGSGSCLRHLALYPKSLMYRLPEIENNTLFEKILLLVKKNSHFLRTVVIPAVVNNDQLNVEYTIIRKYLPKSSKIVV